MKSSPGYSFSTCLISPWLVLLCKFVCTLKSNSLVEPFDLVSATSNYGRIRYPDSRGSIVSTSDLAPAPKELSTHNTSSLPHDTPLDVISPPDGLSMTYGIGGSKQAPADMEDLSFHLGNLHRPQEREPLKPEDVHVEEPLQRSSRIWKPVDRLTLS